MKKSVLKTMQLFALATLLFFVSCTKNPVPYSENPANENGNVSEKTVLIINPFNYSTGGTVSGSDGANWIEAYKGKYGKNRTFTLNNTNLQTILSNPSAVGIALYPAKSGTTDYIVAVGMNNSGQVIKTTSALTSAGYKSWATIYSWIQNANGFGKGRFLGKYAYTQRLKINTCPTTRVDCAVNDNNSEQFLLSLTCPQENLVQQYEDRAGGIPPNFPAP